MSENSRISSIQDLIDRIEDSASDKEHIQLGKIVEMVGRRAFGPILLFAGLVTISPLSGVPGMPTLMGVLVLAVAVQLLMHRQHIWLPSFLLERKVPKDKLCTAMKWSRPPARFVDRGLKTRLTFFTHNSGTHFIAVICLFVAVGMPPMELVPFSVTVAGMTLFLFGLALIAHDGVIALAGVLFAVAAYGFLIYLLFQGL